MFVGDRIPPEDDRATSRMLVQKIGKIVCFALNDNPAALPAVDGAAFRVQHAKTHCMGLLSCSSFSPRMIRYFLPARAHSGQILRPCREESRRAEARSR